MQYSVRAFDGHKVISLALEAIDTADALKQTEQRKLTVLSITPQSTVLRTTQRFPLLLFAQELHALLSAGLSLIEALDALVERASDNGTKTVLERLLTTVKNGARLSHALAGQPDVFPPLLIGIVQASEGTSVLPESLKRYIDYETRLGSLRQKIISAAIYPSILLLVGMAVSLFLLGYVVPRFALVYRESGRSLPWASELLMNWGLLAANHPTTLIAAFVVSTTGVIVVGRQYLKSGGWWRLLAWLPGAGGRLRIFEMSRLYLTLGMLMEGGVPVLQALSLAKGVLPASHQPAVERLCAQVSGGERLSTAMEASGLGTPVAMRLLKVGEQSGQTGRMLTNAAEFYDSETGRWIEQFTKVFEPMLMVAIGLVIGLIVMLLYMPIFDLAGSLQ